MNKGKKFFTGVLVGGLILGANMAYSANNTSTDPLVSLGYLNTKISELESYVDNKVANQSDVTNASFESIHLEKGRRIEAAAGTEIIVRSGTATAVAAKAGGLADTTSGRDIKTGERVEKNHLLVAARDDGRGVKAENSSVYVMVRGRYIIK